MALHYTYKELLKNGSMGASINSFGMDLNQVYLSTIQAIWTGGSANGVIQIQISCDLVKPIDIPGMDPTANVVNWSIYTGSSVAVDGAGSNAWIIENLGFRWMRCQFVRNSGTGLLFVQANNKGP